MGRLIEVVDYDLDWINAFEVEAAALSHVFSQRLLEIHHVGSTAVPNLAAKPIIDILVFDNIGYMRAKDDFVKSILVDARRWYEADRTGSAT
jgi:GrpB-like predicted nucleotidyltransferase (UPF0157 family)